jgi:uncharacterized membrane protein
MKDVIELIGTVLDIAGVAVIAAGLVIATITYGVSLARSRQVAGLYQAYRRGVGRSILLGLEFLVGADIIKTVAVSPTFQSVGVLAIIVAVRTFLSVSLQVELDGRWPWQPPRAAVSLWILMVLAPARRVTGTDVVYGVLLPTPLTFTSIGAASLTVTKYERSPLTVKSMNSVYSRAVSTVTSSNSTYASAAPPRLRTFCPPEQGEQLVMPALPSRLRESSASRMNTRSAGRSRTRSCLVTWLGRPSTWKEAVMGMSAAVTSWPGGEVRVQVPSSV